MLENLDCKLIYAAVRILPGSMDKIRSGVLGLNSLMAGGISPHTTTVVIGAPGAGKTTFATQYLRRGLESGEDCVFITLDESPERIILNAQLMGWGDIEDYMKEGSLVFVDAGGKQFSNFIEKELADFVGEWEGHSARIVIDPLTPVLWSVKERYEQRELVSFLLRETRKMGTVLCTLEEHGDLRSLTSSDIIIPMYLADNVIHMRYNIGDSPERRELKIIKCRSSKHNRNWHPYDIVKGVGLYIRRVNDPPPDPPTTTDIEAVLKRKLEKIPQLNMGKIPPKAITNMYRTLAALREEDLGDIDAEELINLIMEEYDIQGSE